MASSKSQLVRLQLAVLDWLRSQSSPDQSRGTFHTGWGGLVQSPSRCLTHSELTPPKIRLCSSLWSSQRSTLGKVGLWATVYGLCLPTSLPSVSSLFVSAESTAASQGRARARALSTTPVKGNPASGWRWRVSWINVGGRPSRNAFGPRPLTSGRCRCGLVMLNTAAVVGKSNEARLLFLVCPSLSAELMWFCETPHWLCILRARLRNRRGDKCWSQLGFSCFLTTLIILCTTMALLKRIRFPLS